MSALSTALSTARDAVAAAGMALRARARRGDPVVVGIKLVDNDGRHVDELQDQGWCASVVGSPGGPQQVVLSVDPTLDPAPKPVLPVAHLLSDGSCQVRRIGG